MNQRNPWSKFTFSVFFIHRFRRFSQIDICSLCAVHRAVSCFLFLVFFLCASAPLWLKKFWATHRDAPTKTFSICDLKSAQSVDRRRFCLFPRVLRDPRGSIFFGFSLRPLRSFDKYYPELSRRAQDMLCCEESFGISPNGDSPESTPSTSSGRNSWDSPHCCCRPLARSELRRLADAFSSGRIASRPYKIPRAPFIKGGNECLKSVSICDNLWMDICLFFPFLIVPVFLCDNMKTGRPLFGVR